MANYCVAWLLLVSYVVLLGLNGFGIGLTVHNFGLPVTPPPTPPKVNITKPTTLNTLKPYDDYDTYNYRHQKVRVPEEVTDYAKLTAEYADYEYDPRVYFLFPCGVSALVVAPLILAGLCSRKIFSKTIGLYSSVAVWGLTLASSIIYQNSFNHFVFPGNALAEKAWVIGLQISMLIILTIQIILAVWELRRQKTEWPTLHFTHLFTWNTIMLVGRITVGAYAIISFFESNFWYGFRNEDYKNLYSNYDFWDLPRIKWPEYYVFPVAIALLFGLIVSSEGLLSHIFGYVHPKLLCFSSLICTLFYGGIIVVTSPAFIRTIINASVNAELMNMSILAMFLSFIHAVAYMVKPKAMNTPPAFIVISANQLQLTPSFGNNSEGLMNRATAVRNKFKGSNTLLCNIFSLVLSFVAIVLLFTGFRWSWEEVLMVSGSFAMINRLLPEVMMEVLTQKVESVPALKVLMHFLLECVSLIVGVCGTFGEFYGSRAVAVIIVVILVLLQFYKLIKNQDLKVAFTNLAEHEASSSDSAQLTSESEDGIDPPSQNDQESGRIYQPLA